MRPKDEIRADLIEALKSNADSRMANYGFRRQPRSDSYVRDLSDAMQTIAFKPTLPSPQNGTVEYEMHVYPMLRIELPAVGARVRDLVRDDQWPPLSATGLVINEPIELSAPARPGGRYVSGKAHIAAAIAESVDVIEKWVIPRIDQFQSPHDLIRYYTKEKKDALLADQGDWYLYVAAAYLLAQDKAAARNVLLKHLAAQHLKAKQTTALARLGGIESEEK